jgi:hypothetical protein
MHVLIHILEATLPLVAMTLAFYFILRSRRRRWESLSQPCIKVLDKANKLAEETPRKLANAGLGTHH